jgi:uncharacterized LabA/DUF88 family protein
MPIGKPNTIVYIDGFNLYYGALSRGGIGRKWLNLDEWLCKLLPQNNIVKIKFFTARVTGKFDPGKPLRQDIYLRALKTLPNLEIIEGNFLMKKSKIQITPDVCVMGIVPEEKGTDVNIAAHLIHDAHLGKFDVGVIVSNDSDLSEAVRMVIQDVKLQVGIINPCIGRNFTNKLVRHATFKKPAREGAIVTSQFPTLLTDALGQFSKPPAW